VRFAWLLLQVILTFLTPSQQIGCAPVRVQTFLLLFRQVFFAILPLQTLTGNLHKSHYILLVVATVLMSGHARAWNGEGHMVVAQMAYNHLDPVVKTQCDNLISFPVMNASNSNSNFVTSACWADDIKSFTSAFSSWHYIDIPFSLDGTSTNSFTIPSVNVAWAISNCVAALKNPNTSVSNQAMNLRFLIHFVGDIQQPLHDSTAMFGGDTGGDSGGNGFTLTNSYANLHSLWDAGGGWLQDSVGRPLNSTGVNNISNRVWQAEQAYPFVRSIGTIESAFAWATEGWWLARTNAYVGVTNNTTPSAAYLTRVQATTIQRMAAGGMRLANLLNTIYAPPPFPLSFSNVGQARVSVSWISSAGRTYRVQWKQHIDDPTWNTLTDLTATANSLSVTDSIVLPNRFYRVIVLQ
jgi:hypothetical protein